jgi:hypothetical protein
MKLSNNGQKPWYWMGKRIKPIFNKELVIDIHTKEDLEYSKQWLKVNHTY